jgi:hypothetical protein
MSIERVKTKKTMQGSAPNGHRTSASKSDSPRDLDPPFLAKSSGLCCLEGSIHAGDPRGSFVDIAGIDTYVSRPPAHKANGNILLYYPDVWGMFTNGLLVMDGFADAGYLTIGLDYLRGVGSDATTSSSPSKVLTHFVLLLGSCLETSPRPF